MTFHLSGSLFKNVFGTKEMREIFDQESFVQTFLQVESALAQAEAEVNLIPESVAETISTKANVGCLDPARVAAEVEEHGLFSMAIIEAWKAELGNAGEYVHWGATTQDISDTVLVLQIQKAHNVITRDVDEIRGVLQSIIKTHQETPMIGRTQFRHGPPVTFGLVAATWLDELDRHATRLRELTERLFVVQFAGASGTLASLGESGPEVLEQFANNLDLNTPDVGWTATRDRFVELVSVLSALAGALSRIARRLLFLGRPEINEVTEPIPDGEIGSSTNPHKRNPIYTQHTIGLARLVRGLADIVNELAEGYDERDRSTWYVEFAAIPEAIVYLGRMLANTKKTLLGLEVNTEGMKETINEVGSLAVSEAVMMELAESFGRQTAHELVQKHALQAHQKKRSFIDCLRDDPRIMEQMTPEDIAAIADPMTYFGSADTFIKAVIERDRELYVEVED